MFAHPCHWKSCMCMWPCNFLQECSLYRNEKTHTMLNERQRMGFRVTWKTFSMVSMVVANGPLKLQILSCSPGVFDKQRPFLDRKQCKNAYYPQNWGCLHSLRQFTFLGHRGTLWIISQKQQRQRRSVAISWSGVHMILRWWAGNIWVGVKPLKPFTFLYVGLGWHTLSHKAIKIAAKQAIFVLSLILFCSLLG